MSFVAICLCGLKNYGQPFKLYSVCGGFLNGIMDSVHLKEPSLTPLWNGWGNRGHRASVAAAESEGRPFPIASSDVCIISVNHICGNYLLTLLCASVSAIVQITSRYPNLYIYAYFHPPSPWFFFSPSLWPSQPTLHSVNPTTISVLLTPLVLQVPVLTPLIICWLFAFIEKPFLFISPIRAFISHERAESLLMVISFAIAQCLMRYSWLVNI